MFSDDYILRMISQAVAVLARIIGLKNAGQYQLALKEIDQALGLLFGMDAEFVKSLDDESIYRLLMKNGELDVEKLELIADFFKEEGDIQELQNHPNESIPYYIRSLNYYLRISSFPEVSNPTKLSAKIEELLQKLNSDYYEETTLLNLFCYYENTGEFARADNMLSEIAAKTDSTIDIIDEMKSFYQRLLEKSPTELTAGGMNRTEIQKKLRKLD